MSKKGRMKRRVNPSGTKRQKYQAGGHVARREREAQAFKDKVDERVAESLTNLTSGIGGVSSIPLRMDGAGGGGFNPANFGYNPNNPAGQIGRAHV